MKKNRIIVMALIISLMLMTLTACGGSGGEEAPPEKEARTADSYNTVEEGGLSFQIPDYFGDPEKSGNVKNYYAEKGNALSVLQMNSVDGTLGEDDFEDECREMFDSYASGFKGDDDITDFEEGSSDDANLDCGLHCMIYDFSFAVSGIGCHGLATLINNTESEKVVLVSLIQSEQSEYDYTGAYTEIIDTCELTKAEEEASDPEEADSGLLSPEFKKTMDDYEAWFDHYCEVMKKYDENPSDLELLSEMTELLTEETAMLEEMENMDQSEMNTAELVYYLEVTARIEKKLLELSY